MNRATVWRALIALVIVGITGFFAVTKDAQLGLDLRGGTQIVLETQDSPTTQADAEATDRTLEVLRRRVDALGVAEPTLARSGENRIIVELPGLDDPEQAEEALGKTAQLTFHPVLGIGDPADLPEDALEEELTEGETEDPVPSPEPTASPAPAGDEADDLGDAEPEFDPTVEETILDEDGQPIRVGPAALTGEDVADANAQTDPQTGLGFFVSIDFEGAGGREWEELTAEAACQPPLDPRRRVAIVLDGEVISSPQVETSVQCGVGIVGGNTVITGDFSREEATDLAVLIKGGALPVPVETISRSFVGPTLGEQAIDDSVEAAIIGLSLTGLFLIVVYRLLGFLAVLALISYGIISYGTLVALGATLTLPGLGGLLLSAGLAIDANVLVFERAREEYAASRGKRLVPALNSGFSRAFSAIADSNVTTLLAAALLFYLAAGPVRGFGVTLTIGVIASIVSALLVTRVLAELVLRLKPVQKHPGITGMATLGRFREWLTRRNPDLMSRARLWLTISAVAVLVAIAGMFVRGFNFGIEFTGGRVVEYETAQPISVEEAREVVAAVGYPTAVVQEAGDPQDPNIAVRTPELSDGDEDEIREALADAAGGVTLVRDDKIGPTLGEELRNKAILALLIALAAQLIYLAVRFRWAFSTAAVIAMFHDVLIVLGLFAWLGKSIDGVFLAAALTIIGVSINDSIVTLDRIRERWATARTDPLPRIVNTAILQTAPRTINTGLGAMFILATLAILGGSSLRDFALALLVGLVVGTYSSAFTASPLLLMLERYSKKPPPMPPRKEGYEPAGVKKRKTPQPIFQTRGGGAVR